MLLMNICSPPPFPTLCIAMDDTLAEQKQLEFVLQAQGTFYAQVYLLIHLVKKTKKLYSRF